MHCSSLLVYDFNGCDWFVAERNLVIGCLIEFKAIGCFICCSKIIEIYVYRTLLYAYDWFPVKCKLVIGWLVGC